MSTASRIPSAESRSFTCDFMRRAAGVKQEVLAQALGCDDTSVSRILSSQRGVMIEQIQPLLEAVGLKVVPVTHSCIDRRVYQSLRILAGVALANPELLNVDGGE